MQTDLPKLALGTWLIGGTKEPDPNNDDAKDISVIQTAIDSGITLIDTAQNYAAGRCEELVGEAIATLPRESVKILTKQSRLKLSHEDVIQGCHDSLARLGVETIDYFVCHAPNADFDLKQFFKATNQLHKEGLIQNVGVSNFGVKSLQIAVDSSELPIALNQVSFSINDSDILTSGTYDFCLKHKIPVQAYRPLVDIQKEQDSYDLLLSIAKSSGLTPHQVLIAYLNSYEGVNFTLRASSEEHWQQIKDAINVSLEQGYIGALKRVHMTKQGAFSKFLDL